MTTIPAAEMRRQALDAANEALGGEGTDRALGELYDTAHGHGRESWADGPPDDTDRLKAVLAATGRFAHGLYTLAEAAAAHVGGDDAAQIRSELKTPVDRLNAETAALS